jgi:hypothetical protein
MPSANDKTADSNATKTADAGTSSDSADVAAASAGVQGQQSGQQTGGQTSGAGLGMGLRAQLPAVQTDPRRILWWGGLAAAGVVGLVEWPVVAAVGVGSWVAEQFAKDDMRRGG